ncbi:hypothetical protein DERP_013424 [Dermatophagoides pteronyssinus]|uniref:Uncharacterized protein n=1 Tax=Dermatophagoides pteronyssinus TaxID=6956 RepID=A0ABQ8JS28_DERPT|nr:hypothetical protein DERP_013424 [Dermatophagoides pteronyssinus]
MNFCGANKQVINLTNKTKPNELSEIIRLSMYRVFRMLTFKIAPFQSSSSSLIHPLAVGNRIEYEYNIHHHST